MCAQGEQYRSLFPQTYVSLAIETPPPPRASLHVQGEQHGFRKAASIRSSLEGEMYFYGRVLGFPATYSDDLQPMFIDNLDPAPSDKTEL